MSLAIPCVFCSVFVFMQELVNLAAVSTLENSAMIAALGLGNAIQNMFGLSLVFGMNNAISTLACNAAGAKDYRLCLVYLRRGQLAIVLCFIPIILL